MTDRETRTAHSSAARTRQHAYYVLSLVWATVILLECGFDVYGQYRTEYENALAIAKNSFHKDILYRSWVGLRGGVYVPVTEQTPANPSLAGIPERDVVTPSGRMLTLVNPEYMARQVHELDAAKFGMKSHLTSLKPLRKENVPDEWERTALRLFEQGTKEYTAKDAIAGETYLRYMRPLLAEADCLTCHGQQGYKLGEVRGGLSVSILWAPYAAEFAAKMPFLLGGHLSIWCVGMIGLFLFKRRQNLTDSAQDALVTALKGNEGKLEEMSNRFKVLFDEAPDAYLLLKNGVVMDANRATSLLLRDDAAGFIGQTPDYFSPQFQPNGMLSRDFIGVNIDEALSNSLYTFEWLCRRLDGSMFNAEVTLTVLQLDGQSVLFASLRDITKRTRLEAQLHAITDSSADGMMMMGPSGAITFWNPAAGRIFGYSEEEAIGRNLHTLLAPVHLQAAHREVFSEFQRTGRGSVVGKTTELIALRKDGQEIHIELALSAVQLEGGWHAAGVIRDVTEQKKHVEIQQSERFIRTTLNGLNMPVCVVDSSGTIVITNRSWDGLSGVSEHDIFITGRYLDIIRQRSTEGWEEYAGFAEAVEWAFLQGGNYICECPLRLADEEYWFLVNVSGFTLDNNIYAVISHENISALKLTVVEMNEAKEQADAATRTKSTFLATMSHEIRTPLGGVIGMTDMLLETQLDEEQRDFAEMIRLSGYNLLNVVNDILDFSKIEAGRLDIEIVDFDLRSALKDAVKLLSLSAQTKGLTLNLTIQPAVPSFLKGDPGRINQIITNLVGNAIKFTPKGNIDINVSVRSEEEEAVTILFEIVDSGIGIPADRLSALFTPFTQVDGSTARKYGGTGLGLAICKLLTELMHGEIGATSVEGNGSTFWFTLHFDKQLQEYLPKVINSVSTHASQIKGAFILVVDDDEVSRLLITTLLTHWDCRFEEAPDGETALLLLRNAALRGDPFQVALLDQSMPGMDGLELAQRIKSTHLFAQTYLVMVTAFGQRGDVLQLGQSGFAGYLVRPLCAKHLHDCLTLVLMKQDSPDSGGVTEVITQHTVNTEDFERVVAKLGLTGGNDGTTR